MMHVFSYIFQGGGCAGSRGVCCTIWAKRLGCARQFEARRMDGSVFSVPPAALRQLESAGAALGTDAPAAPQPRRARALRLAAHRCSGLGGIQNDGRDRKIMPQPLLSAHFARHIDPPTHATGRAAHEDDGQARRGTLWPRIGISQVTAPRSTADEGDALQRTESKSMSDTTFHFLGPRRNNRPWATRASMAACRMMTLWRAGIVVRAGARDRRVCCKGFELWSVLAEQL